MSIHHRYRAVSERERYERQHSQKQRQRSGYDDERLTLGPKYVNGNRKISEDVETLPSRRVMTVVDRVSHEGSSWVGCAIT